MILEVPEGLASSDGTGLTLPLGLRPFLSVEPLMVSTSEIGVGSVAVSPPFPIIIRHGVLHRLSSRIRVVLEV
jgi:hypothetical protein